MSRIFSILKNSCPTFPGGVVQDFWCFLTMFVHFTMHSFREQVDWLWWFKRQIWAPLGKRTSKYVPSSCAEGENILEIFFSFFFQTFFSHISKRFWLVSGPINGQKIVFEICRLNHCILFFLFFFFETWNPREKKTWFGKSLANH